MLFQVILIFISIHAPTRGATVDFHFLNCYYFISIHAPTRGATLRIITILHIVVFQSTLLQEERLYDYFIHKDATLISIHAPTRGATHNASSIIDNTFISIHAPTRGATFKSTY